MEREADHSPPSSAEVRLSGAIPPLPNTSSWRGAQFKKSQGLYLLPPCWALSIFEIYIVFVIADDV